MGPIVFRSAAILCFLLITISPRNAQEAQHKDIKHPELPKLVRNWAEKLGGELWHFGELVTRKKLVEESFKYTDIVQEDGVALLKDIKERIKKMMEQKEGAVRRIMEVAENAATKGDIVDDNFNYYNAKELLNSATKNDEETEDEKEDAEFDSNQAESLRSYESYDVKYTNDESVKYSRMIQEDTEDYQLDQEQEENNSEDMELPRKVITDDYEQEPMASLKPPEDRTHLPLYPNPHFYDIEVNTNVSAVHVPSNVYDRSQEVIKGIKWSEELDQTFRNNYKQDPSLSWQYFGSSMGFMRQFPAIIWTQEPIDLFDCRTRNWYIEAASSPKDIVILIDRSGSMTGMRREIAKHVVNNILDTLGNNDYVNIYTFGNTTEPLVECFDDLLVQANLDNVRHLKEAMSSFRTEQIANFTLALTTAFTLLQDYRDNRPGQGAQCNQAIMLVTDGVYESFREIFEEFNWRNLPFMPVRMFTYLIGREVSDVHDVKWMACANQGYYVHLSTYAEVREQVLQYIPVMARPMVLNPNLKPNPTWSPVYADATDPKLTNYLWEKRERNKQRDRFLSYKNNKNRSIFFSDEASDRKYAYQQTKREYELSEERKYRMMTSVSLPVYDKRQNANISEKIQINEKIWITVTRETRVANLLGVAGTDVPIEYIKRLLLPYRLGVNGYAFIVTNNGYILIHPDLRPVFQGILKPAYNRVDMIEVELQNDDSEPRKFSDELKDFRRAVVNQTSGQKVFMVKTHIDQMKRIMFGKRFYYFMGIPDTPFTVVVALPDRYGSYRIQYPVEDDPHRIRSNNKNLTHFFTGNWTIHPDWHYCRYLDDRHNFRSPEEELLHFLHKMEEPGWRWSPECDRKLICKVVADAKSTDWYNKNISASNNEKNGHEFIKMFGITVAFLATHSGLTRWQDFPQNVDDQRRRNEQHFHLVHNKAIDEVWYRRAVEQYYIQPRSFVYSVPFGAEYEDNPEDILVTASHAIFKGNKTVKAPAAVVGFQFYHSTLHTLFQKITNSCGEINCKRTCSSEELDCLVLDDSGYIIVSYDKKNTGVFLGDIRRDIMELLVEERIYTRTRIYDYQATCFPNIPTGSPATRFRNPLFHLNELVQWALATLFYLLKSTMASDDGLLGPVVDDEEMVEGSGSEPPSRAFEKDFDQRLLINKTQPEPCDKEMFLYSLLHYNERNISSSGYNKSMTGNCSRPFLVQPVVGSNMILLVINRICPEMQVDEEFLSPNPIEVDYNMSRQCHIVHYNNFTRRNYMSCINRSIHESAIEICGKGVKTAATFSIFLASFISIAISSVFNF
ncbi:PREDICTED: voltage-dependent calcium channel subunit alpha-2/delta-3 isoform X2 [Nicrophorus vespilloides]|uniref:Voltage-dependent calcium channel subunit alpha-2/delta-3 isoform X2 n=1 Tax=Nicrophorus vespilloides TaxID=110193 RepID=A0ABM1MBP6_NICVS|nr:PREDICTED: voltage-dependent calcium channel subunit alpha-2/delta-3 isoform X2 [Nicrophorus vespilloides]